MKLEVQSNKVVVLSGSGVSAESGLPTFRDSAGIWNSYSWEEVSSPQGWEHRPEVVLDFYDERRRQAWEAAPNAAHHAIAALEASYEVIVITQNVDELHERAGSSNVIHVHGQIAYARGTSAARRRYKIGGAPISMGQLCEDGTQLRSVFLVAALVKAARGRADKVLVGFEVTKPPYGYTFLRGKATEPSQRWWTDGLPRAWQGPAHSGEA